MCEASGITAVSNSVRTLTQKVSNVFLPCYNNNNNNINKASANSTSLLFSHARRRLQTGQSSRKSRQYQIEDGSAGRRKIEH